MRRVPRPGLAAVALGLIALFVACAAAPASVSEKTVLERVTAAGLVADFSYADDPSAFPRFSNLHLTLQRGSQIVLDEPVTSKVPGAGNDLQPGGFGSSKSISFRDLDGDGTAELLLTLYTGGAHCCFIDQVYDLAKTRPVRIEENFADGPPTITRTLASVIFKTFDASFDYEFTDFADSDAPIKVLTFAHDRFLDVTRQYPSLIRANASAAWKYYLKRVPQKADERGVLAAWSADEALLGESAAAKARLLQIAFLGRLDWGFGGPKGSTYVRKLWLFLRSSGYLK